MATALNAIPICDFAFTVGVRIVAVYTSKNYYYVLCKDKDPPYPYLLYIDLAALIVSTFVASD